MNIKDIIEASYKIIELVNEYHNIPDREMLIDPILYAYLDGHFGNMQRQHYVYLYGSAKPKRIDFRFGGNNPVVIEFVVRSPTGGGTLYGSQNVSELRKLSRVEISQARLRVLLLVDLYWKPLNIDKLKSSYEQIHAGPGNFTRNSVRVIYVHNDKDYKFLWNPYEN